MSMVQQGGIKEGRFVADKEHFTQDIVNYFFLHPSFDILMPAPSIKKIYGNLHQLEYQPPWAGYALAETIFKFDNNPHPLRLLVQRQGERPDSYTYQPFLST